MVKVFETKKITGTSVYYHRVYDKNVNKSLEFVCENTATKQGSNGNCYFPRDPAGKYVKIGLGKQPDCLMFSNDTLKVVTLEADGKEIIGYERWLDVPTLTIFINMA